MPLCAVQGPLPSLTDEPANLAGGTLPVAARSGAVALGVALSARGRRLRRLSLLSGHLQASRVPGLNSNTVPLMK